MVDETLEPIDAVPPGQANPVDETPPVEAPPAEAPADPPAEETPVLESFERSGVDDIVERARQTREDSIREHAEGEAENRAALGIPEPEPEVPLDGEGAPEAVPPAEAAPTDGLPDDAVVSVKVFGEDKQITLGELRKNAQMYMAGEEHFNRARAAAATPPAIEIPAGGDQPPAEGDSGTPDPAAAPNEAVVGPDLDYDEPATDAVQHP